MFLRPASHYPPLHCWVESVRFVDVWVRQRNGLVKKSVVAILGRSGKSWLPGVWEKCSWQVVNPGIPLCCPLEKHNAQIHKKLFFWVTAGLEFHWLDSLPGDGVTHRLRQLNQSLKQFSHSGFYQTFNSVLAITAYLQTLNNTLSSYWYKTLSRN